MSMPTTKKSADHVEARLLLGDDARLDAAEALSAELAGPVGCRPARRRTSCAARPWPSRAERRPGRRSWLGTRASRRRPRRVASPPTPATPAPRARTSASAGVSSTSTGRRRSPTGRGVRGAEAPPEPPVGEGWLRRPRAAGSQREPQAASEGSEEVAAGDRRRTTLEQVLVLGPGTVPTVDLPVMPPVKPMLAKAVHAVPRADGLLYEPKWDGFRCIVFRDGDELELGSRNDRPAHALLPGARGAAARRAAGAMRGRRRDRRRHRRRARLRRSPAAPPPGGVAGPQAGRGDAGQLRGLRPARARRPRPHRGAVRRASAHPRVRAQRRPRARAPHPDDRRPGRGRGLVHALRGRRASTG